MKHQFKRRFGLTLVELMVVLAIIAILVGLIIPAIQRIRTAALRTQGLNKVKQICLAVHGYTNVNRSFPQINGFNSTAKKFEFSFFVSILPYLEHNNLYVELKKKYPSGSVSDDFFVPAYYSPLDPTGPATGASYCANGSLFNRRRDFSGVPDGSSNTVAIAEHYSYDCGGRIFSWVWGLKSIQAPGGLETRRASFADQKTGDVVPLVSGPVTTGSIAGLTFQVAPRIEDCDPRLAQAFSPSGMTVGVLDGTVRTFTPSVSASTYWAALTPSGGEVGGDW